MISERLRSVLFRYGWDTRCRNLIPARLLRSTLRRLPATEGPVLLDVGCGRLGLAAFLPEFQVVGLDVEQPVESAGNFIFKAGDITSLPFPDNSFPVVSCVDVLEHLPLAARSLAISEILRVASEAVLIACPDGDKARDSDEGFRRDLVKHGRDIPNWVNEHQQNPYPLASEIMEQVRQTAVASGKTAKLSLTYCEPTSVGRLVRAAAARSDALFAAVNLLLGAMLPLFPTPEAHDGYRMIVLARLGPCDSQRLRLVNDPTHLVSKSAGVTDGA
jgi:SAM-dependent methyltransferase